MQEFAAELERLDDCEMLLAYVCKFAQERGVTAFSYHFYPPFETANSSNAFAYAWGFPLGWQKAYVSAGFKEMDPLPGLTFENPPVLSWERAISMTSGEPTAALFFAEMRKHGVKNGASFALYGPKGRAGYASMVFEKPPREMPDGLITLLHGVVQSAHSRIAQLTAAMEENIELSERESQVLNWMAKGKPASDIATILEISPDTVKTYVKRIYEKLSVGDRVAAAVKGLRLGLIEF